MNRRAFLTRLGAVLAAPLCAEAQQAGKSHRIGVLTVSPPARDHPLREALREFGYAEGRNLIIDWRSANGDANKFAAAAAEIVHLGVEVIVAPNNPAIQAAQSATKTIPIVMVAATDPVGLGFVTSLPRPGGNITGLTIQSTELVGKHLELLKDAIPKVSRVGVLWDPGEPGRQDQARAAQVAAPALGSSPNSWRYEAQATWTEHSR
jgi:putative ABC transport system substrate-binding protein